ncbi:MAG: MFS transporter [Deltaproteobacteria bacterium]|nr:MFS transporter [Deltaproteobacteria bacterium]
MGANSRHRSPWFILVIVLLTSIAAPLNQFKVPPVLPLLMDAFHQTAGRAGLLMSVFAVTGLILAIPGGFIFQRLGYRITGLIAILSILLGAGMGTLSGSMETMLASRFIEGAGLSLMSVVAPAILALWFTAANRGKAMGIWAIWVPLGSTMMFMLAPLLASRWSWPGVWGFGFFYTVFVGVLYYFFIRSTPESFSDQGQKRSPRELTGPDLTRVLRNRGWWLISFLFGCFNFVFIAFITWAPTFLHQIRGSSLARASLLVSAASILSIVSCPTTGWISDKIGSRKLICVLPMLLLAFLFPISFSVSEDMFLPLVMALGFIGGFVPAGVFSSGVEVVGDERLGGMAMAVIQIGQNGGMLLGPLIFGWMVESWGGWQMAFWTLTPLSVIGAIAGWRAKIK